MGWAFTDAESLHHTAHSMPHSNKNSQGVSWGETCVPFNTEREGAKLKLQELSSVLATKFSRHF